MDDREMEERLVGLLKSEGLLRGRPGIRWIPVAWGLAAAVVLFAAGIYAGATYSQRNSLETLLDKEDMPLADRILLMQRAGTAYIQAAHAYGQAARTIDPVGYEVANRVLTGAANALPRAPQPQLIRY